MKYPKQFNKWSLEEQERWLIAKLQQMHIEEDELRRTLATVRNGYKYEPSLEERPDLEYELPKPQAYDR